MGSVSFRRVAPYILSVLLSVTSLYSQQNRTARLLRFDPAVIDLGNVDVEEGTVEVVFTYVNISDTDVVITDVRTPCMCAVPKPDHRPVGPGKTGKLIVEFRPEYKTEEFTVDLKVTADNGEYRKFNAISIKGNVTGNGTKLGFLYPYELFPGVHSNFNAIGMRHVSRGVEKVREMELYNSGERSVRLDFEYDRTKMRVKYPPVIPPGGTATVEFIMDGASMPDGEFGIDTQIIFNGVKNELPIPVKGTVVANK